MRARQSHPRAEKLFISAQKSDQRLESVEQQSNDR
jgi:hypothetical protein